MATDTGYKLSTTVHVMLENYDNVVGQYTPIVTSRILAGETYGAFTPISGMQVDPYSYLTTNVSGVGDIIFYGDELNMVMDSGVFSAPLGTNILMSGLCITSGDIDSVVDGKSHSVLYAQEGQIATLPAATNSHQAYFYFANPLGVSFGVTSESSIISASGSSTYIGFSAAGTHLGVVSDGIRWIAVEESGLF